MTTGRINQVANHVTHHQLQRATPFQPVSRLDQKPLLKAVSSPPRCDFLCYRTSINTDGPSTWHILLPLGTCSNLHHPNRPGFRSCQTLPSNHSDRCRPEVRFAILVEFTSQVTASPDKRIQIYSHALQKSKPTSSLGISWHTTLYGESTEPQSSRVSYCLLWSHTGKIRPYTAGSDQQHTPNSKARVLLYCVGTTHPNLVSKHVLSLFGQLLPLSN